MCCQDLNDLRLYINIVGLDPIFVGPTKIDDCSPPFFRYNFSVSFLGPTNWWQPPLQSPRGRTIFGYDCDDVFVYDAPKTIRIRDARLGLLQYVPWNNRPKAVEFWLSFVGFVGSFAAKRREQKPTWDWKS